MSYQIAVEIRDGEVRSVRAFDGTTVKGLIVNFDREAGYHIEQIGDEKAHVYITHEGGKPRNLKRLMELWREYKKYDR